MARWSLHPTPQTQAEIMLIPTAFGLHTQAPAAILSAGADIPAFEPLLGVDIDTLAIGQLSALDDEPPYGMCEAAVQQRWQRQQWPVLLPSEMSASWGAIRGLWKHMPQLTVVHFSAHAHLLAQSESPELEGGWGDSGWLAQVYQYQLSCVQIGLRCCSSRAFQWMQDQQTPVFWAQTDWTPTDVTAILPAQSVFLAIDIGVLDPAHVSSVPKPEPGGLSWVKLLRTCEAIFKTCPVAGVSLGGLAVMSGTKQSARSIARLLNWLIACYATHRSSTLASPFDSGSAPSIDGGHECNRV